MATVGLARLVGGEPWSRPVAAAHHLPEHHHHVDYDDHFIKIMIMVNIMTMKTKALMTVMTDCRHLSDFALTTGALPLLSNQIIKWRF